MRNRVKTRSGAAGRALRILRTETVYRGRVVTLKRDRIVEPGGIEAVREVVVHRGSVVMVPWLDDGRLILVRQYRYAVRRELWELVAGTLEPGEPVLRAARRELMEEAGYRARRLRRLFSFYPSPGFLTEQMHVIEARDLVPSQARPEPDERLEVGLFTLPELDRMIASGEIRDGKTLLALLWSRNS
jgi:ADP-ribose pyrophosphatase